MSARSIGPAAICGLEPSPSTLHVGTSWDAPTSGERPAIDEAEQAPSEACRAPKLSLLEAGAPID